MVQILRRLAIFSVIGLLGLTLAAPVFAKENSNKAKNLVEDRNEDAGSRPGLLRGFLNTGRAAIGSCTIVTISTTGPANGSITCTKDSKTYTVNSTDKTELRRRFWGKASWSEFSIGDLINVIGRWADSAKTTVNAVLLRDLSIQKRFGVFIGTVTSVNSTGLVMQTVNRGSQTVTVTGATKFTNRLGRPITQADIKVGDRVRVRGLWDNKANTITEVTVVKDYNIPSKPTPSVTGAVTPAATPTLTPTPTPTP